LQEIQDCLEARSSFGLESTLSGLTHLKLLKQARALGYRVEIYYLWLPSPALAMDRIAQRVEMGGHFVPGQDVIRRFSRSVDHFLELYAPAVDYWSFRDNSVKPPSLLFDSSQSTLPEVRQFLFR
jgi:predicted ABC-type ATPase